MKAFFTKTADVLNFAYRQTPAVVFHVQTTHSTLAAFSCLVSLKRNENLDSHQVVFVQTLAGFLTFLWFFTVVLCKPLLSLSKHLALVFTETTLYVHDRISLVFI